ncbi:MAG: hypothetical protein AAF587_05925 [Bacteroidota bacterium]
MNRIPLVFLFFFSLSFLTLSAQSRMDQMLTQMQTTFELNESQTAQVRTILNETATEMQAIRQLRKTDRQAFRQKRKPIMQQMENKLLTVLDDNQAAQFRQMRQNSRQKGQTQAVAGASAPTISADKTSPVPEPQSAQEQTEGESYTESTSSEVDESWGESESVGTDPAANSNKEDMLEKTLDFLYEGFLRPAVQGRKRKNR